MDDGKSPCSKPSLFYPTGTHGKQLAGWYHDYFCPFIHSAADQILKEIGKENIDGILLCGSFATGEGSIVLSSFGTLFLSDIDIVVVINSLSIHQSVLSGKRKLGSKCERLWGDAKFRGKINIGIYYSTELYSLPPNPGVYDMKEKGLIFFEREGFANRIPLYRPNDITREEAIILIENRVVALLGAHRLIYEKDKESSLELIYEVSRVYTDILICAMIFTGEYRTGYKSRLEFLKENREHKVLSELFPFDMLKKIEEWTLLKLDPSSSEIKISSRELWEECALDLFHYWKLFQSAGFPKEAKNVIEDLLSTRKSKYSLPVRLKLWRNYFKRFSLPLKIVRIFNTGTAIYKYSPKELVANYGIRLLHCRINNGEASYVNLPPGCFPYDSPEWSKAAEELYSLWVEFISG